MTAAVLIAILCVALVLVVGWPLVTRAEEAPAPSPGERRRAALEEELERSLAAIREIELDHRAGNLSDEDFAELDRDERARAVELMRRRDALAATDDATR